MRSYPQRVRDNILPLSVADTLPKAFEEWSFTDYTLDHESPIENCELCEQEELRYHFEIKNTFTKKTLMVGSQCILKFDLSVFEEGRRLSVSDAKKKLHRLMQKMKLDSCIRSLERLATTERNPILPNALAFYQKNKYLTPKFAFVVLWKLKSKNIDHSPSFFKVTLKREKYKTDLKEMPLSHVHAIWPALTSAQRKIAISLGHSEPPRSK